MAVTEDGAVYSCGWGADGQTGLESYDNCTTFTRIKGDIENERIVKISSRSDCVLAVNGKCLDKCSFDLMYVFYYR